MQGTPADMQRRPRYDDVVAEVHAFVLGLAAQARAAGVAEVWLDPGIGFGKTAEHNLSLLHHVGELAAAGAASGHPVLVGTSRKAFLGTLSRRPGAEPLGVDQRAEGSLATATWCLAQGVAMVRVHDVAAAVLAAGLVAGQPALAGVPA
jgi:dihydropteroate synthase